MALVTKYLERTKYWNDAFTRPRIYINDLENLTSEFLAFARTDDNIRSADVLFCSHPALFCSLFFALGKPILGYFGTPTGTYLLPAAQEVFYGTLHDNLVPESRNMFAGMSSYISAWIYMHAGVKLASVRPVGLYTFSSYKPQFPDVLVTKNMFSGWDLPCVLNRFTDLA